MTFSGKAQSLWWVLGWRQLSASLSIINNAGTVAVVALLGLRQQSPWDAGSPGQQPPGKPSGATVVRWQSTALARPDFPLKPRGSQRVRKAREMELLPSPRHCTGYITDGETEA